MLSPAINRPLCINCLYHTARWNYETTVNSLAGGGICAGYLWRHNPALLIRLDRREHPGFALFRGQRIHLGAHEAAVLAPVSFCVGSAVVFKDQENYWCVKLAEILLGLVLIPVLFYSYNGVFGKSPDWVNIAIFYITVALVFLFERWAFKKDRLQCKHPKPAFAAICLIGMLFVVFTFPLPGGFGTFTL